MNTQVYEGYTDFARLFFPDVFQDIELKVFPQVIIIKIPAKGKGNVKNAFFHEDCRVFRQVKLRTLFRSPENGPYPGEVAKQQLAEAFYFNDFVIFLLETDFVAV
jgi:hypothetical protein